MNASRFLPDADRGLCHDAIPTVSYILYALCTYSYLLVIAGRYMLYGLHSTNKNVRCANIFNSS